MATRALLGSIQTDAAGNQVLTSTYNHYDGYPENLGAGLDKYYDQTDAAIKISNQGYISYLDPETGAIEAKHRQPADKTKLSDSFEDAMREVYSVADSYGADYIYLYDFENMEWVNARVAGSQKVVDTFAMSGIVDQFDSYEGGDLADEESIRNMEENMEDEVVSDTSVVVRDAEKSLKGEHAPHVKMYIDSLTRDIRLNGDKTYEDYDEEDFQEDFREYIADKMSMEESLKTKWQYRAGIKK